jgi:hypothetical protein
MKLTSALIFMLASLCSGQDIAMATTANYVIKVNLMEFATIISNMTTQGVTEAQAKAQYMASIKMDLVSAGVKWTQRDLVFYVVGREASVEEWARHINPNLLEIRPAINNEGPTQLQIKREQYIGMTVKDAMDKAIVDQVDVVIVSIDGYVFPKHIEMSSVRTNMARTYWTVQCGLISYFGTVNK